jgi:hypothetical protein
MTPSLQKHDAKTGKVLPVTRSRYSSRGSYSRNTGKTEFTLGKGKNSKNIDVNVTNDSIYGNGTDRVSRTMNSEPAETKQILPSNLPNTSRYGAKMSLNSRPKLSDCLKTPPTGQASIYRRSNQTPKMSTTIQSKGYSPKPYTESVESKRIREARLELEMNKFKPRITMGKKLQVSKFIRKSGRTIPVPIVKKEPTVTFTQGKQEESHSKFAQVLTKYLTSIKKAEEAKTSVFKMEGFSPNLILSLITKDQDATHFSFEHFRSFIVDYLGLTNKVDTKSLMDFFVCYNKESKRTMTVADLVPMIVPSNSLTKPLNSYPDTTTTQGKFEAQDKELVQKLFKELFELKQSLSDMKDSLKKNNIEVHTLFDSISVSNGSNIDGGHISKFLAKNGAEIEKFRSILYIFVKNCDMDGDGVINFKDFYMFLTV